MVISGKLIEDETKTKNPDEKSVEEGKITLSFCFTFLFLHCFVLVPISVYKKRISPLVLVNSLQQRKCFAQEYSELQKVEQIHGSMVKLFRLQPSWQLKCGIFHVQRQLLGFGKSCHDVTSGSPAGNCRKNAKVCPCG